MSKLKLEPAAISGALVAIINLLVLFGVVSLTPDQIAAVNTALAAVLAVFVRQSVTPVAKFDEMVDPAP
ncbi:MAG: hypothetical protein EBR82_18035 [Caulobacteraceae bacterium]|nr:hypothetical protein [Caulobacteraceae bacterium]